MSKDNTQLPAEVVKRQQQLEDDPWVSIAYIEGFKEAKNLVATEYATKLQQTKQMLFRLASLVNAEQRPTEQFMNEIKQFLDGTK